jgi:hypothetical protein
MDTRKRSRSRSPPTLTKPYTVEQTYHNEDKPAIVTVSSDQSVYFEGSAQIRAKKG